MELLGKAVRVSEKRREYLLNAVVEECGTQRDARIAGDAVPNSLISIALLCVGRFIDLVSRAEHLKGGPKGPKDLREREKEGSIKT